MGVMKKLATHGMLGTTPPEAELPLPEPVPLRGSEKQIVWAESVRYYWIRCAARQGNRPLVEALSRIDDAVWFIKHSDKSLDTIGPHLPGPSRQEPPQAPRRNPQLTLDFEKTSR